MAYSSGSVKRPPPPQLTPFPKGVSGNPRGRPPRNREVEELAAKESPGAFERIVALSQECRDLRVYFQANLAIVERHCGKPKQDVEMSGPEGGPIQLQPVDAPPTETLEQYLARRHLSIIDMQQLPETTDK